LGSSSKRSSGNNGKHSLLQTKPHKSLPTGLNS
jgi:hypothetical protein